MDTPSQRAFSRWLVTSLAVALCTTPAAAQDTTRKADDAWLVAYSVGFPGMKDEESAFSPILFTVGVQFTQLRMSRIAPDFSVGTMPVLFAAGLPVLGVRAGIAVPMAASPDVVILPSGGLSTMSIGVGDGAAMGGNIGIGIAALRGLRASVTWHKFLGDPGVYWLFELGVSHSKRPIVR